MNTRARATPSIEPLSDNCLLLRLGDHIEPTLNARVHALAESLQRPSPDWLQDLVPAYASLAVFVRPRALIVGAITLAQVEGWLRRAVASQADCDAEIPTGSLHELPVWYGRQHGPDLDTLAAELGLSPACLIERHSRPEYRVALLGFAPGFPYLLGMDPGLAAPRLATPRASVPAGSVGIAGEQTGIYPRESPGGWRLIGRCPLTLFDPVRSPPCLLLPGDRVRFVPVDFSDSDPQRDAP